VETAVTHILLNLADVLDAACNILEELGVSPTHEIETLIAQRITRVASRGERDRDKLLAAALDGVVDQEHFLGRPQLLN
jgi:hypothetical protein